ncbi:MAG: hypothetical protein JWN88_3032 [Frankiales bacterium]|nr:hypothetical protein [Frankiales bacterium]
MSGSSTAILLTGLATGLSAAAAACLVGLPGAGGQRVARLDLRPHDVARRAGGRRSLDPTGMQARLLAAVAVAVASFVLGPVAALLGLLAALVAGHVRHRRQHAAAEREERRRAVEACGALAAELRAGRAPAHALGVAAEIASGPSRAALRAAAAAAQLGGDVAGSLCRRPPAVDDSPVRTPTVRTRTGRAQAGRGQTGRGQTGRNQALRAQAGRTHGGRSQTAVPELLRALAACWTVCSSSGSGLATAVERLEEGLRAEQARRRAVDAELAGPRATAALLAVLPLAGMVLATGLGADPVAMLLHTPLGLVCLSGGLLLDALGLWWTARLVARAGRAV